MSSSIHQWIRTACRMGRSGTAGDQTYAASSGISEAEDQELARLTYLEPAFPDREAVRSFGFTRLSSSGRCVLFRAVQKGARDDLGRPATFSQAFVFDDFSILSAPPYAFADSPQFRPPLSEDEASSPVVPPNLPLLAPAALQPSPWLTNPAQRLAWMQPLIKGAGDGPGRLYKLLSLIEKCFDGDQLRPLLLAATESEAIAAAAVLWELCGMAPESGHLRQFSFASFLDQGNNSEFRLAARPAQWGRPSGKFLSRFTTVLRFDEDAAFEEGKVHRVEPPWVHHIGEYLQRMFGSATPAILERAGLEAADTRLRRLTVFNSKRPLKEDLKGWITELRLIAADPAFTEAVAKADTDRLRTGIDLLEFRDWNTFDLAARQNLARYSRSKTLAFANYCGGESQRLAVAAPDRAKIDAAYAEISRHTAAWEEVEAALRQSLPKGSPGWVSLALLACKYRQPLSPEISQQLPGALAQPQTLPGVAEVLSAFSQKERDTFRACLPPTTQQNLDVALADQALSDASAFRALCQDSKSLLAFFGTIATDPKRVTMAARQLLLQPAATARLVLPDLVRSPALAPIVHRELADRLSDQAARKDWLTSEAGGLGRLLAGMDETDLTRLVALLAPNASSPQKASLIAGYRAARIDFCPERQFTVTLTEALALLPITPDGRSDVLDGLEAYNYESAEEACTQRAAALDGLPFEPEKHPRLFLLQHLQYFTPARMVGLANVSTLAERIVTAFSSAALQPEHQRSAVLAILDQIDGNAAPPLLSELLKQAPHRLLGVFSEVLSSTDCSLQARAVISPLLPQAAASVPSAPGPQVAHTPAPTAVEDPPPPPASPARVADIPVRDGPPAQVRPPAGPPAAPQARPASTTPQVAATPRAVAASALSRSAGGPTARDKQRTVLKFGTVGTDADQPVEETEPPPAKPDTTPESSTVVVPSNTPEAAPYYGPPALAAAPDDELPAPTNWQQPFEQRAEWSGDGTAEKSGPRREARRRPRSMLENVLYFSIAAVTLLIVISIIFPPKKRLTIFRGSTPEEQTRIDTPQVEPQLSEPSNSPEGSDPQQSQRGTTAPPTPKSNEAASRPLIEAAGAATVVESGHPKDREKAATEKTSRLLEGGTVADNKRLTDGSGMASPALNGQAAASTPQTLDPAPPSPPPAAGMTTVAPTTGTGSTGVDTSALLDSYHAAIDKGDLEGAGQIFAQLAPSLDRSSRVFLSEQDKLTTLETEIREFPETLKKLDADAYSVLAQQSFDAKQLEAVKTAFSLLADKYKRAKESQKSAVDQAYKSLADTVLRVFEQVVGKAPDQAELLLKCLPEAPARGQPGAGAPVFTQLPMLLARVDQSKQQIEAKKAAMAQQASTHAQTRETELKRLEGEVAKGNIEALADAAKGLPGINEPDAKSHKERYEALLKVNEIMIAVTRDFSDSRKIPTGEGIDLKPLTGSPKKAVEWAYGVAKSLRDKKYLTALESLCQPKITKYSEESRGRIADAESFTPQSAVYDLVTKVINMVSVQLGPDLVNNGKAWTNEDIWAADSPTPPTPEARKAVVELVQEALSKAGYRVQTIDGKAGPGTVEAILLFERESEVAGSGRISAWLLKDLGIDLAAPAPAAPPKTNGEKKESTRSAKGGRTAASDNEITGKTKRRTLYIITIHPFGRPM